MISLELMARAAPRTGLRCLATWLPVQRSLICLRHIATKRHVAKALIAKSPLAGIKVLDMTRVLAGVGVSLVVAP